MTPARSTDDLPLPDAPTTATSSFGPQPLDQLADHRLPTEEIVAVLGLEREQAAIWALGRGKGGADPGRLDRANLLGCAEPAQAMGAEIDQFAALGQMRGDQLGGN